MRHRYQTFLPSYTDTSEQDFSTTVLQHFVSEKKKVQLFINYRTIHVFNQRAGTVGT